MLYDDDNLLLAPLCGYTDLPFRRACRQQGCRYAFTPLVDAGSLIYNHDVNDLLLRRGGDEPWLGVQVLGTNPEHIGEAVRLIASRHNYFDVIDLNLGCPVPKVVKKGAGAAMGRNLEAAVRSIEKMVAASPVPVTAKTRIVNETDPELTVRLALALEAAGIQALTLHGRILEEKYSGPVFGDMIRAVREAVRIPVIANGGVFNRQTADCLRQRTGCSHLMIARGAIGNPWIFRELYSEEALPLPAHDEICTVMEEHVLGMAEFYGEEAGLRNARKVMLAYLASRGYASHFRAEASLICTVAQFREFLARVKAAGQSPDYLARPAGRASRMLELA
jgi:nifR3 family TIM-barrel protein